LKLHQAFHIVRGDVVAFIGAGGKTSTLIRLGYELADMGWRVLATTTTTIETEQLSLLPRAIPPDSGSQAISQALTEDKFVFLYDRIKGGAVYGAEPDIVPKLMDQVDSDVLLIEADSADGKPLKAPYDDEPVIPPETSLIIQVSSLSAIGKPLDSAHVYNVDEIINRYGFPHGAKIRAPWVAQVIRDRMLGLKNVPVDARTIAFLNQTTVKGHARIRARLIAKIALKSTSLQSVIIGSARSHEPIIEIQRPMGAVVLAAGLSSRMGQSKMLLDWSEDKTVIEHIIAQLMATRLEHITIVTGHKGKEIKSLLKSQDVDVVHNRSYKSGEMLSSLKVGLDALPDYIMSALIVLGDQPQIKPKVLYQLLQAYAEGTEQIVVPSFKKYTGNPIIVGRRYWDEILSIPRDGSLQDFLARYADQISYVKVDDDCILRDIDTPQDYTAERWRAGFS
jgi:probable selenium-dependent hydroxylase accessory protein YqeC